jgi:hypothetical protein
MPCKWVSLSIGAPLGNLEGTCLPGLFERNGGHIWVPFLDPVSQPPPGSLTGCCQAEDSKLGFVFFTPFLLLRRRSHVDIFTFHPFSLYGYRRAIGYQG